MVQFPSGFSPCGLDEGDIHFIQTGEEGRRRLDHVFSVGRVGGLGF